MYISSCLRYAFCDWNSYFVDFFPKFICSARFATTQSDSIRYNKLISVELEIWRIICSQYILVHQTAPTLDDPDGEKEKRRAKESNAHKQPKYRNKIHCFSVVSSAIFPLQFVWYWLLAFLYFHCCLFMLE